MRRAFSLIAFALLLFAVPAGAAEPEPLVLVFTGDNGGEVAPCG